MKKMTLRLSIRNYHFTSTLLSILTTLFLFLVLIGLGVWQIYRGNEKAGLQTAFTKQASLPPILIEDIPTLSFKQNYSPVLIEGYFDNDHSFLVDNRIYQHQIGYEVLTPFFFKKSRLLVNRGWVPQGENRKTLPKIIPTKGNIKLQGFIVFPKKTFHFKQLPEQGWPKRIQTISPEFLNQHHLKPFILIINKKTSYSFTPLWKPITLRASQHYAYAFQWFSLSLTLLIAFFSANTKL